MPSIGSTAMSVSIGVPSPIRSPLNSIGASSFSPSPMTTIPSIGTVSSTTRMASTAAPSAPFLSPRPIQRLAARAAASVVRASSRARLRSGRCLRHGSARLQDGPAVPRRGTPVGDCGHGTGVEAARGRRRQGSGRSGSPGFGPSTTPARTRSLIDLADLGPSRPGRPRRAAPPAGGPPRLGRRRPSWSPSPTWRGSSGSSSRSRTSAPMALDEDDDQIAYDLAGWDDEQPSGARGPARSDDMIAFGIDGDELVVQEIDERARRRGRSTPSSSPTRPPVGGRRGPHRDDGRAVRGRRPARPRPRRRRGPPDDRGRRRGGGHPRPALRDGPDLVDGLGDRAATRSCDCSTAARPPSSRTTPSSRPPPPSATTSGPTCRRRSPDTVIRVILAELEVFHSRPIAPTRRVALGRTKLPVDPAPGFGGLLLGGIVAGHMDELDPELFDDLHRLTLQLEAGQRIPQPRLRHRFQTDRIGLTRSVHRLVGDGRGPRVRVRGEGRRRAAHPRRGLRGRCAAARSPRAKALAVIRLAMRWSGPLDQRFVAHLSGLDRRRTWSARAVERPGALGDRRARPRRRRPRARACVPDRLVVQRRFRDLLRDAHPDHGGRDGGRGRPHRRPHRGPPHPARQPT